MSDIDQDCGAFALFFGLTFGVLAGLGVGWLLWG